ncbi:MAG: MBL fold metallo-hydrolase [Candidatus Cloacimonetes bacterium]|jgi:glyoxylase-like metal-dependent hydrolase (beta-lactamase superfamily II)|nr:MBL fold metallo-hydrolase [Candidatus Cloacimonadota bacterium]MDD4223644.1 MBL fold metallo-hydrolase [Candidatus Cloacimonadota bacterium]
MLKIEVFHLFPEFGTNTWLLWDESSRQGFLIDPAAPSEELLRRIQELQLQIPLIINTHGHGDHIGGNDWFKAALGSQVLIHPADAALLTDNRRNFSEYLGQPLDLAPADSLAEDGQILKLGDHEVLVLHTPGHTQGCICLLADKFLFSGDTLFEQSIGRTDFPGGSHDQIVSSIRTKLFTLPDDTVVFPGHGPRTSIGLEKKHNPFVRP